jgi:hypothetical protein
MEEKQMKKLILFMFIFMFLFTGCSFLRKSLVTLSEEDIKNADATRIAAKNFLTTWNLNYGFIMGMAEDKIPKVYLDYMEELKTYADRQESLNDYDLGFTLGRRVLLLASVIKEAVKIYAPDVLKYITFL